MTWFWASLSTDLNSETSLRPRRLTIAAGIPVWFQFIKSSSRPPFRKSPYFSCRFVDE